MICPKCGGPTEDDPDGGWCPKCQEYYPPDILDDVIEEND